MLQRAIVEEYLFIYW